MWACPNPSAFKKLTISSVVLPFPWIKAASRYSWAALDITNSPLFDKCFSKRLHTPGCKACWSLDTVSWRTFFKVFVKDLWSPLRQVLTPTHKTFSSRRHLSSWFILTTYDPGGAKASKAKLFRRSCTMPSFSAWRQYPSYSTNRAVASSFSTPWAVKSGSK